MARHPDLLIVLISLAVTLALCAPVVIQPMGLVYPPRGEYTDLTITHWPNIAFAVASFRATGRLPLWRPLIMSGTPFAANPLSGLFYLPHVIFLVLPLAAGFNALFIAHIWLTGCGAYALLRAWQAGRAAAFIGAVSGVIGLYLSYYVSVASGAAIVLVCTVFFLLALFFAPTRGIAWQFTRNRRRVR